MDSIGEELERLARLKESGDLSDEEYELLKSRLINSTTQIPQKNEETISAPEPSDKSLSEEKPHPDNKEKVREDPHKQDLSVLTFILFGALGAVAAIANDGAAIDAIFGALIVGGIAGGIHKSIQKTQSKNTSTVKTSKGSAEAYFTKNKSLSKTAKEKLIDSRKKMTQALEEERRSTSKPQNDEENSEPSRPEENTHPTKGSAEEYFSSGQVSSSVASITEFKDLTPAQKEKRVVATVIIFVVIALVIAIAI